MKKIILSTVISVVAACLVIPISLSGIFYFAMEQDVEVPFFSGSTVYEDNIDMEDYEKVAEVPEEMEEYIVGVVAAEMPAAFEMEALKAQAVAARTYAINSGLTVEELTQSDGQAYNTVEEMKNKWGDGFDTYYGKIKDAVYSTAGEIAVYNDEPILAVFHAISCGKTETSENVWERELPYLKSVDSSEDEKAKEFYNEKAIDNKTAIGLLQQKFKDLKVTDAPLSNQMQILERTDAGYISKIQVGNMVLTGKNVREALGLRSSNFTFEQNGSNIIFKTKGYGHGAGMSQYGANFMAADGKNYKEILEYYYSGIEIKKYK